MIKLEDIIFASYTKVYTTKKYMYVATGCKLYRLEFKPKFKIFLREFLREFIEPIPKPSKNPYLNKIDIKSYSELCEYVLTKQLLE